MLATILMLIGVPGGHAILGYCIMDHIYEVNVNIGSNFVDRLTSYKRRMKWHGAILSCYLVHNKMMTNVI